MADKGGKRKKHFDVEEKVKPEISEPTKIKNNLRTRAARSRPELLPNNKQRFKSVINENIDFNETAGSRLDKSRRDQSLTDSKSRSEKRREPSPDLAAKKLKCSSPSTKQHKSSTSLSIPSPRRLRSNLS